MSPSQVNGVSRLGGMGRVRRALPQGRARENYRSLTTGDPVPGCGRKYHDAATAVYVFWSEERGTTSAIAVIYRLEFPEERAYRRVSRFSPTLDHGTTGAEEKKIEARSTGLWGREQLRLSCNEDSLVDALSSLLFVCALIAIRSHFSLWPLSRSPRPRCCQSHLW